MIFQKMLIFWEGWEFDGKKVVKINPDPLEENTRKKRQLINEATAVIATLQDAV